MSELAVSESKVVQLPSMPIRISNDEYHAHPAISKTKLDLIADNPHSMAWAGACKVDHEKLSTFDFGDAMHAICLEPDRLHEDFAIMPDFNLRASAGKYAKAEFEKENSNKKILSAKEHKKLILMYDSVMSHPQARDLIEAEGVCEGSYFWTDEVTGLDCKCRPDKEIESRSILTDIKTTDSLKKFCYSVEDYRYYVQDPFYCDGVGRFKDTPKMLFLVIQKTIECGRYPVAVWRLPEEAVTEGRKRYKSDLMRYRNFLDSGKPVRNYNELKMHYRFIDMCMENMEIIL